jgi:hypothetical protein
MKTLFLALVLLAIFAILLSVGLGIAFLAYWLVLMAGAPKYVAMIVGIAVFCTSGWVSNKYNRD